MGFKGDGAQDGLIGLRRGKWPTFSWGYARGRSKPRPYEDETQFVAEEVNSAI